MLPRAHTYFLNLVLQVLQWVSAACWLLHILASVQQLYSEGNAGPHIPTSQHQLNQLIQRLSAQLRSTSPRLDEPDSEHARMLGVSGGGGGGAGGVRAQLARHQREQNRKHDANNSNGGASLFDRLRYTKQPHARLLSQPDSTSDGRSPLPSAGVVPSGEEPSALPCVLIHPPTGAAAPAADGDGEAMFHFSHVSDSRSLLDDLKNVNTERKPPQTPKCSNPADFGLRANGHSNDQLSDDVFAPDDPHRATTPASTETSRAAVAANTLGERSFTGVSGIELDDIDGRLSDGSR